MKIDVDLLRRFALRSGGLNAGAVEPVPLEQIGDAGHRRGGVAGQVGSAQSQLGGHQQLPFVGRLVHSIHVEVSDEIRGFGDEFQIYSGRGKGGVHGDVGIFAGFIQALNGVAQIGGAQRLPDPQREHRHQLIEG